MRRLLSAAALAALMTFLAIAPLRAAGPTPTPAELTALEASLRDTERAFAATMAKRDLAAFASFLADDTIFIGREARRGKTAVVEAWKAYFEGKDAPFSWEPSLAVVLASGALGLTSGPVFDPDGTRSGTFTSTWRREADGSWRIVLDKGCPPCDCGKKAP